MYNALTGLEDLDELADENTPQSSPAQLNTLSAADAELCDYACVILHLGGTVLVDTFALWRASRDALDSLVLNFKLCHCCGPPNVPLSIRIMEYDNPFASFAQWRTVNPTTLDEYALKSDFVEIINTETWQQWGRSQFLYTFNKFYSFWLKQNAVIAPGLVTFVDYMDSVGIKWFVIADPVRLQLLASVNMDPAIFARISAHSVHIAPAAAGTSEFEADEAKFTELRHETTAQVVRNAEQEHQIARSRVLILGSTRAEAKTAESLGVQFRAVSWGYGTRAAFESARYKVIPPGTSLTHFIDIHRLQ
jgi:hypothetical protein